MQQVFGIRRSPGRRGRLTAAVLAAGLLAGAVAAPAQARGWGKGAEAPDWDVPAPEVELLPVTDDSTVLFGTDVDLASKGYVEEEYLIRGDARWYDIPEDRMSDATEAGEAPYATRIVVRRPESPRKFNGTAVVEWNNVSAGFDLEAVWYESAEHIVREGYAWVGVSAQRVGANFLPTWDEERYGEVAVDAEGVPTDALSYDIFAQAIRSLKDPAEGTRPMGRLDVKRVIATGASQSAGRLAVYHNTIQPLHGIVDAFLWATAGTAVRADVGVPVIKLLSESDVRIPSDEEDTPLYRRWEVAGTSHVTYKANTMFRGLAVRDLGSYEDAECDLPPRSRIQYHYAANAALDHLVRWIRTGKPAPAAPRLEWEDGAIARDERGNALGGIRLPSHAVPTALNAGPNTGPGSCGLLGTHQPFDDETLRELYPSRGRYVAAVKRATAEARWQGFMVKADAREQRRQAVRDALAYGRE